MDPSATATTQNAHPFAYFATLEGVQLAAALMERVHQCQSQREKDGTLQKWRDAYAIQYGCDRDEQGIVRKRVLRDPKNPAVLKVTLNHWGSILRSIVILVTSQQLALQAEAKEDQSSALTDATRGTDFLEDAVKSKGLAAAYQTWVRHGAGYGIGWLVIGWNLAAGPDMASAPGEAIQRDPTTLMPTAMPKEGTVEWRNPLPTEVYYDSRRTDGKHDWIITAQQVNRFDLAAQVTDEALRRRILAIGPPPDMSKNRLSSFWTASETSSDLITLYEFRHKKTAALPGGKCVRFLSGDILLPPEPLPGCAPGALPYEDLYCFRLTPEDMDDTAEGHTSMFDLMAAQEAHDVAASTMLSKQKAGMPVLLISEHANIGKKQLGTPFAIITHKPGEENKPQMWSATVPIDQDLQVMAVLQKNMETLSGINSVVRGNPEEALKDGSGAALALVQAQAILGQSRLQQNALQGIAQVGTAILECHKRFNVGGHTQAQDVPSFKGSDLSGASGVRAQTVNPLTQTLAGRQQLLESFQKMGALKDPKKMIEFLGTGSWKAAVGEVMDEDVLIKAENEQYAEGRVPHPPLIFQNHFAHLRGHLSDFADPAKWESCAQVPDPSWQPPLDAMGQPLMDPATGEPVKGPTMPAVLADVLEHINLWSTAPAAMLMAADCPPFPVPMPPPGMAPPGPGGPPHPAGPPARPAPPAGGQPGAMPHMPTMPNGQPSSGNSPTPPGVHP